jgi:SAM-dependent methyltransferase
VTERFNFEAVDAADYDALRPGYASDAVAWVIERGPLDPASLAIDFAAGTGQLSRHLDAMGIPPVAIVPASNMRATLRDRVPSVRVICATAEALPFEIGSVDAVVGNAFHHFERDVAFREIHRVLRGAGTLAMFWAWPLEEEQRRIPGIDAIYGAVHRARRDASIVAAYRSWADPLGRADGFGSWERWEFPHTHVIASARKADLYATSSDIGAMAPNGRTVLLGEIGELARALPEILRLPSRTVVDVCTRSQAGDD